MEPMHAMINRQAAPAWNTLTSVGGDRRYRSRAGTVAIRI